LLYRIHLGQYVKYPCIPGKGIQLLFSYITPKVGAKSFRQHFNQACLIEISFSEVSDKFVKAVLTIFHMRFKNKFDASNKNRLIALPVIRKVEN